MVTRVVTTQAKTTTVKNKFVNEKKSSKEYSVVFLVEGEKIQFRRKSSGEKFNFALSVLLRTWSAHRLSSQHFAAASTPNIVELVFFGFFCPLTTMVF